MADIVKIRACVFIPAAWVSHPEHASPDRRIEYEGDNRGFTPHTANTFRFRVEQEVVVDFYKRELFPHASSGVTRERVTERDGTVRVRTGRASTDGITCERVAWHDDRVDFEMRMAARNPLVEGAKSVDYHVQVTVHADGAVAMRGSHDGFPCYEFYKQVDFGDFQTIYTHDHRTTGDTLAALGGPMEYTFERKV